MVVNEIEVEQQLKEVGNRLLDPPSSIDELLNWLDKLEHLLINVEQAPSRSMQDALLPSMKALISNALLRNSDADVKVSVVSCLSELTRISAPDPPYDDDHMKEIFQLTVAAFEKLSHVSSRCYMKAVSILETLAKVRSCLIMLDLKLDELIVKMFQHFLKIIRSSHPHAVFLSMESIMTLIIDESDNISVDLLAPLLASVRKANQSVSPMAWKLGEKVIVNSASKLKYHLKGAVKFEGRTLDEYAPIVASICQDESQIKVCDHVNGSKDHLVTKESLPPVAVSPGEVLHVVEGIPVSTSNGDALTRDVDDGINDTSKKGLGHCSYTEAQGNADPEVKLESELVIVPRKRGWKPNSLMNPEEGYEHCWIATVKKGAKVPRERSLPDKGIDLHLENSVPKKLNLPSVHVTEQMGLELEAGGILGVSTSSPDQSLPDGSHHKRGRPKKTASIMNEDVYPSSLRTLKVSNTDNEEKALSEDESGLKRQFEGWSNIEKQHRRSRKVKPAAKTAKETSLPSANLFSGDKDGYLSEPEEKPLHQSTQIEVRRIKKEIQTDHRKRSLVISISNLGVAEESRVKKIKSSSGDENYEEETPNKFVKRKRTPRKEVHPTTPDLDEKLIGRRIKVWWPKDRKFYKGVVDSYDRIKKKHLVLYADGDVERLNLRKQRWELIGEDIFPDKEQVTDVPKADSSPDELRRGKEKAKSESAKQLKLDRKRSRAASIPNRRARSSGNEFADGAMQDEPGFVDKANSNASRPDGVLEREGEGEYSTKKSRIKSAMIDMKSETLTLESGSPEGANECFDTPEAVSKGEQLDRNQQQNEVRSMDSEETS